MKTCKVCGKQIPNRLTYCSKECEEKDKATKTIDRGNPAFLTQFDKGHGSFRRERNIRQVVAMIEVGMPEDEIRFQLGLLFRQSTIDDYLQMAKECLKRKGS